MRYFLVAIGLFFGSLAALAEQPFGPGFNPGYRPNPYQQHHGMQPGMFPPPGVQAPRRGPFGPGFGGPAQLPAQPPMHPGFGGPGHPGFVPPPTQLPAPLPTPPGLAPGIPVAVPKGPPLPLLPEVAILTNDLVEVANQMKLLIEKNRMEHFTIAPKIFQPVQVPVGMVPGAYGPFFLSKVVLNVHELPVRNTEDYWITASVARFEQLAKEFKTAYHGFRNAGAEPENWIAASRAFGELNIAYQNAMAATFYYTEMAKRSIIAGNFGNGTTAPVVINRLYQLSNIPFPGQPLLVGPAAPNSFYRRGLTLVAMDIMHALRRILTTQAFSHAQLAQMHLFPVNCYEATIAPILVNPMISANVGFMPLPFWEYPGGGLVPPPVVAGGAVVAGGQATVVAGGQQTIVAGGQGAVVAGGGNVAVAGQAGAVVQPKFQNGLPPQGYPNQVAASYPYVDGQGREVRYSDNQNQWSQNQGSQLIPTSQVPPDYYRSNYQLDQSNQQNAGREFIPNQNAGQGLERYRQMDQQQYYQQMYNNGSQPQGNNPSVQMTPTNGTNIPYNPAAIGNNGNVDPERARLQEQLNQYDQRRAQQNQGQNMNGNMMQNGQQQMLPQNGQQQMAPQNNVQPAASGTGADLTPGPQQPL